MTNQTSMFDEAPNVKGTKTFLLGSPVDDELRKLGVIERDLPQGEARRDEALAAVTAHTPESYRFRFALAADEFLRAGRPFTSEDITAIVGLPPAGTHPNAVGALTRANAKRLGMVKVGRVKATRTNQHATEIALWGRPGWSR